MCVCVYMFVCMCEGTCATECMWWSEGTLLESILTFYHVGPRDQTQIVRLGL